MTLAPSNARAQTWLSNPGSGDWNTATNWNPGIVPNGIVTATFDTTTNPVVTLTQDVEVSGITFNNTASPYTITLDPLYTLSIFGTGITNNSGVTQNFVTTVDANGNAARLLFSFGATAGSLTQIINESGVSNGGYTYFTNSSTAGSATIINQGGAVASDYGGEIYFENTSTAGSATLTNQGGFNGGTIYFVDGATAGSATITSQGSASSLTDGGAVTSGSATAGHNHHQPGRRGPLAAQPSQTPPPPGTRRSPTRAPHRAVSMAASRLFITPPRPGALR